MSWKNDMWSEIALKQLFFQQQNTSSSGAKSFPYCFSVFGREIHAFFPFRLFLK